MNDYQTVLIERAEHALDDAKPLDHVALHNKHNLQEYANRRLRHSLGLPMFHVTTSWWRRFLAK